MNELCQVRLAPSVEADEQRDNSRANDRAEKDPERLGELQSIVIHGSWQVLRIQGRRRKRV
jgi:hypothetical protein